jgi:hypothetical protein
VGGGHRLRLTTTRFGVEELFVAGPQGRFSPSGSNQPLGWMTLPLWGSKHSTHKMLTKAARLGMMGSAFAGLLATARQGERIPVFGGPSRTGSGPDGRTANLPTTSRQHFVAGCSLTWERGLRDAGFWILDAESRGDGAQGTDAPYLFRQNCDLSVADGGPSGLAPLKPPPTL